MNTSPPDFDAIYQGQAVTSDAEQIPWNIGEPQPPIAALLEAGRVRGDVLDAGCGIGETALYLAARGFTVVGLDASPTAIGQARAAATERGLDVEFTVADITDFTGYDDRFATVIDSTLFHSMPVDSRDDYLRAIARASTPDAVLHVLVFASEAGFSEEENSPNTVDEPTLRDTVGRHWIVDEVRPSAITAVLPPETTLHASTDEQGRALLPAYLLSAHLPG